MAELYERLQRWLDEFERDVAQPEPLLGAVRAVLDIHRPGRCNPRSCETVRAIARALDVQLEDS